MCLSNPALFPRAILTYLSRKFRITTSTDNKQRLFIYLIAIFGLRTSIATKLLKNHPGFKQKNPENPLITT